MIKLLIVDDEKITRDSLENFIPWSDLGIGIVKTAKNGIQALELAKDLMPDIILCDVRMPKMNGVEFATKLRETDLNCKIIFLSAYSDKNYLKSAITLKALDYIEKPILIDELKKVIMNAVSLCVEEEYKKNNISIMKIQIDLSLPFILQKITLDLINENTVITDLAQKYGNLPLNLFVQKTFTISSIILNWNYEIDEEEKLSMQQNLLLALYKDTDMNATNFIAGLINYNTIAFILLGDYTINNQSEIIFFSKLKNFILDYLQGKFSVSIGVGPIANSISEIPISYQEATRAANLQFYVGANKILFPKDMICSRIESNPKNYIDFKTFLKKESNTEACELIENITNELMISRDSDINYVKNIYFKLLLIIFDVSREKNLISSKEEDESRYIWKEINQISTLKILSEYIISTIKTVLQNKKNMSILNKNIDEIKAYIQKNYSDKNLSVQAIANHVYLSHTYLCAFFKKITGETVNDYITRVRIDKAKELLKNNRLKLYEITINIGLTDSNYFSSIFKKHTGSTPTEFRERYYYDEKIFSKK